MSEGRRTGSQEGARGPPPVAGVRRICRPLAPPPADRGHGLCHRASFDRGGLLGGRPRVAGDAVAPSRLLRLGFRADVPHRQQVLARGARLDEVVAADRRVDRVFVVGHSLDDGAGLGRARVLGERGRPEEASVSEEGAWRSLSAWFGEGGAWVHTSAMAGASSCMAATLMDTRRP